MKNNLFLHLLFIFLYATFLVAENSFPNIGQGQLLNISFLCLLLLINYRFVTQYGEIFMYGFLLDSLASSFYFGFFTALFLMYLLIIKSVNAGSFKEFLFLAIFLLHYSLTSIFLNSFSISALLLNLIFYLVFRFLLIIILRR